MMKMPKENIFSTSDCLSSDAIIKYLDNQLSFKERHKVEKHMLECEFCNEAMEGFSLLDTKDKASGIILELNKGINYKSDATFDIRKVAAGVAAILVLGGGLFYLNYHTNTDSSVAVKPDTQKELQPDINNKPVSPESPIAIETKPKSIENDKAEKLDKIANTPNEVSSDAYIIEKPSVASSLNKNEAMSNKNINAPEPIKEEEVKDKQIEMPFNEVMAPAPAARGINAEPEEIQLQSKEDNGKKSPSLKKSKAMASSPSVPSAVYSKPADVEFYGASDKKELFLTPLESGVKKYEEKKYKEAILVFEAVIKSDSINARALYYNGLSYYDSDILGKALDNFGRIKMGMDYFEDARWKRALILIKQSDTARAKKLLMEISSGNGVYKNNAVEELKKLE